ncbi:MAG TPA: hypothetical protein PK779_04525 [Niabella sp.]|nr:hypothetical protein [Niabella sp.]HQW16472.1 hypothetical protein [Niabella sp.]HQX21714.1 hypothetical protein [Niabella sp.]HQX40800.1 hypothetical protein [Niabella sp.]
MKTILFFALIVFGTSFLSCSKKADQSPMSQAFSDCIYKRIEEIKKEPVRNPAASIWQYTYKGKTVYYEPSYCCDFYSTLYDSNCNIICHPDGGIAGNGDRMCTDFFDERSNERLVWKDDRKQK